MKIACSLTRVTFLILNDTDPILLYMCVGHEIGSTFAVSRMRCV